MAKVTWGGGERGEVIQIGATTLGQGGLTISFHAIFQVAIPPKPLYALWRKNLRLLFKYLFKYYSNTGAISN